MALIRQSMPMPGVQVRPRRATFFPTPHAATMVAVAFVTTRILVFLVIFVSSITIPMRQGPYLFSDPNNRVLDGLVRDDSWWYRNIAERGYQPGNIQTGEQGNTAFFPVYPLLVRIVSGITHNTPAAGILISNLAFFVALAFLYKLTRNEWGDDSADRAVFYLAAAPTAVFFSAMYTESVYVMLTIMVFYFAQRRTWALAALCGALAAATRNTGILLALVIALEGLHQQGFRLLPPQWSLTALVRRFRRPAVASIINAGQAPPSMQGPPSISVPLSMHIRRQLDAVFRSRSALAAACWVPIGILAYMAYLAQKFGDPLSFIHVQATWGRNTSPTGAGALLTNTKLTLGITPTTTLATILAGKINPEGLLNTLSTIVFGALVIAVAVKMRPAYAAFAGLTWLAPLSTGTVGSMTRYILMLIPCFMLLAYWGKRQWVDRLVLALSLPFLAYFAVLFSHWYFAG